MRSRKELIDIALHQADKAYSDEEYGVDIEILLDIRDLLIMLNKQERVKR